MTPFFLLNISIVLLNNFLKVVALELAIPIYNKPKSTSESTLFHFIGVQVPSDTVLLSKLFGPEGTFYFTSYSPGEHIICLESNSTRFVSVGERRLRIHLDIRVGEHDLDAAIAQAKDKVNEVTFKLEHLMEQIEQILKEQNYQRDREEIFRMTSEDTNSNVLWWAFAQTLIFISVGVFQMKYLKDFFIAKKLV
uniref:GOLD domain-containing protein n=1 Tax=Urocitellus parryii TaxID=9999 RepID=A0A8D2IK73_UROPR